MRLIVVLLFIALSNGVFAQFAANYELIVNQGSSNGVYTVIGLFTNAEPVKSDEGKVYSVTDLRVDSTHYYVDIVGSVYYVVGKSGTTPLTLSIVPETPETNAPIPGAGQLTSVNQKTNEFYISGPTALSLKAKIQRINLIRRFVYDGATISELEGYFTTESNGTANIRNKNTDEIVKLEGSKGISIVGNGKNRFRIDNVVYTDVIARNYDEAKLYGVRIGEWFIAAQSNTMGQTPGDYVRLIELE